MRDETPLTINDDDFNIIVNLHPTDGTHWVLVIRRRGGKVYYIDSFGVDTPPLFLEEYVDLGSNERIQAYDESYCGAYCVYIIHLIDIRFIIEGALDILVNQVKCTGMYDKRFCFSCKDRVNVNDNDNVNVNVDVNDNVNDNVNVNGNGNVNDNANVHGNDNVNGNVNDNDNGNGDGNDNVNGNVNDNANGNLNGNGNDNVNDKQWTL